MGGPTGVSYITFFSRYSFPVISSSFGYCKTRSDCRFSQMISILLETSSHCNRTGWISTAPIKLYHIFLIKSNVFIIILLHYYYNINFLGCQVKNKINLAFLLQQSLSQSRLHPFLLIIIIAKNFLKVKRPVGKEVPPIIVYHIFFYKSNCCDFYLVWRRSQPSSIRPEFAHMVLGNEEQSVCIQGRKFHMGWVRPVSRMGGNYGKIWKCWI